MIRFFFRYLFLGFTLIALQAKSQYCEPQAGCQNGEFINDFTFNNLQNLNSGGSNCSTGGFVFFNAITDSIYQTQQVNWTVRGPLTPTWVQQGFAAWIDFNHDSTFAANEMVFSTQTWSNQQFSGTFTIPASALPGITRLRVRSISFSTIFDTQACDLFFAGETEDYNIKIKDLNFPPIPNFTVNDSVLCDSVVHFTNTSFGNVTNLLWDFGDGVTSSQQNPTHIYKNPGVYTVSLTTTNSFGSNTKTKLNYIVYVGKSNINVANCTPAKNGNFSGYGITYFRLNNLINTSLDATQAGAYEDFTCYGDTLQPGQTYPVEIICNQPTTHNVRVWIDFNNDGNFNNNTELVLSQNSVLQVNSQITIPSVVILNTPLRVRVMADDDFFWGGTTTACDVLEFGQGEDYYIVLKQNQNPPIANFSANKAVSCNGQVQFTDLSANVPTSWFWDFGDGNTSTLQNPVHQYNTNGVYTVSLTVSNTFGNNSISKTNFITVDTDKQLPPACIPQTVNPISGYGIFSVSFSSISNQTGGSEDGYMDYSCEQNVTLLKGNKYPIVIETSQTNFEDVKIWIDFNNDASFSSNEEVFASFSKNTHSGQITISNQAVEDTFLRMRIMASAVSQITGPCGNVSLSQTEDYGIKVVKNPNKPVAQFSSPNPFTCNGLVNFVNLSNPGTSALWDFGDGQKSNALNPTHQYVIPGIYKVTLIANNALGFDTLIKESFVHYNQAFCDSAKMLANTQNQVSLCNVSLTDIGGRGNNYQNNSNSVTVLQPTAGIGLKLYFIQFDYAAGDFIRIFDGPDTNASLLGHFTGNNLPNNGQPFVSTLNNLTIKEQTNATVTSKGFYAAVNCVGNGSKPQTNFTADSTKSCSGRIQFTNQTTNNPTAVLWNFGDGNTSTDLNPFHDYLNSGNYTVTLTTANNFGVDTMQKAAYIAVGPVFCATSITEHNFSNQINVYPNPASTSFHINFAQPFTGKLSVITIAGNSVLSKEVNMVNHALIQIEQLSAGMYLLRLENQKGYVAFKKLNVAKY